jgi:hypothetical protein
MSDCAISLTEFTEGFLISIDEAMQAHELHGSSAAGVIHNWLVEMHDDARAGHAADVARWAATISEKVTNEIEVRATYDRKEVAGPN